MIQHLDDGTLQTLLDQELSVASEQEAREHLATCIECRARYSAVRESNASLTAALRLLDRVATADGDSGSIAADRRALGGLIAVGAPLPASRSIHSSSRAGRRVARWGGVGLARAAGLLLTVTAAASATIPGSPVRGWLMDRLAEPAPAALEKSVRETESAVAVSEVAEGAVESGITVAPLDGELRIVLTDVASETQLRARLVDRPRGGVYAVGAAASARFRTAAGAIEVVGVPGGEVRVEIPRAAQSATVTIDGRPYLAKQGDELLVAGGTRDTSEAEILLRVGP